MKTFLPDTDVKLSVSLVDADGNAMQVSSIKYRVLGSAGGELMPLSDLAEFTPDGPEAIIPVEAIHNSVAAGELRELRTVELQCVTADGNTVPINTYYSLQPADPLVIGVNSFQTLGQAEFQAAHMPGLEGWAVASTEQKIAAMVTARLNICRLNFTAFDNRPEGTVARNTISPSEFFGVNRGLGDISVDQFLTLPVVFRHAACLAQVAEADALLSGNSIDTRRQEGLVLDTIGESKQMFRSGKPLQLPVCRRALGYIGGYITYSKGIAR